MDERRPAMRTPGEFRVGIIGMGFIGSVHAYAYRTLPFYYDPPPVEARITRVVTAHPETAERGRRRCGAESAATDFRRVTEDPDIDIVHICTPNHLHLEALRSALAHGKHVYCDKPLVADWSEARQLAAQLPTYRGVAQMTFQCRFFPAVMRAAQLIADRRLGQMLFWRCSYLHGGNADPGAPWKWKLSAEAGGGAIADLASHAIDLVWHLLGPVSEVCAVTHQAFADRPAPDDPDRRVSVDAEDSVQALVRLQSGTPGVIEATKLATGTEDDLEFEFHGTSGAVRFQLMQPHYLEFFDRRRPAGPLGGEAGWTRIACGQRYPRPASGFPTPKAAIGWLRAHVACLGNFLTAVAGDQPAIPGLDQGILVQRAIEAIRRSAQQRRWVALEEFPEVDS